MPAGKLREATGGRAARRTVNVFQENPIVIGPRTSRNKRKIVEVPTSDDDDDDDDLEDQEEDEVDDEDAPGEDDDEDADADGDIDMDDVPPQPPVRRATKAAAPRGKAAKSVEAKEMELEEEEEEEDEVDEDEDDEALSDTDTDAEGELDDQEESAIPDVNVDDLDEEDEEDELDEDMEDSDAMALNSGKTTKRQRGNLGNDFLQLPMGKYSNVKNLLVKEPPGANKDTEPQVKKHLTAEERAMRRAEMARRRKNLSEKRNEEEKVRSILYPLSLRTSSLVKYWVAC
jgi:Ino eighty subunit 2